MTTTTKGLLWEIAAPLVRWPFYSPMRLVGVAAVLLLTVVGISVVTDAASTDQTTAPTQQSTPTATETEGEAEDDQAQAQSNDESEPGGKQPPTAGRRGPAATAGTFVKEWARPDAPRQEWLRSVSRLAEEGFAQALTSTDPGQVPASRVVGTPRLVLLEGTAAEVLVRTDGPTVRVFLGAEAGTWRVVDLLPAQEQAS